MKLVEQKMKGEEGSEEEEGEEEGGAPALPVTMLQNIWTNSARKVIYFNSVRVGKDTFSCGECVMMDTESGRFPAEILYIFKDKHGGKWVENRWLFTKDEVEEQVPRNMRPPIDDEEVFETNSVQANPAGAILHKIAVLDEESYRRKAGNGTARENDRFCRWSLDTRLNRLIEAGDQAPGSRLRRGRRFSEQSGPPADSESDDGSDSSTSSSCDDGDSIDEQLEHPERGAEDESHSRSGDQQRPSKRRRRSSQGGSRGGKGPKDKFSVAMDSLHVTAVPKSLPCRTKEQRVLLNFLRSNIKSGGLGNAMFVAGMPGTGKTATAHEVVSILREEQASNELPCFKLVELNGMRLTNPHQAYTQLWMSLSGVALSPKRALSKLDRYFSQGDPSRDFVVLLVDELDYMTTSKQTVLYNLFEWPSRPHARLVVVGIANTMDLPERCMPRVSSRLTSRITFPAYKRAQLVTILEARLAEANSSMGKVFDGSAVTMAAAKVGSASGDMRTCLKYCCRAVEVCRARVEVAKSEGRGDEEKCQVSVDDVRRAVQEITQQAHLLAVRDSSPQERLLLLAICNEIHHGGKGTVGMDDVRERMEGICRAHPNGPRMPNAATILEMLSRLGDEQVLLMDLSRRTPLPDVELNMTVRDVVQMLRDDVEFSGKVLPAALTAEYPPLSELPE